MSSVFREKITRIRPGSVDDGHGNQEADWGSSSELTIAGWAIDAGDTTADRVNREGSSVAYTIRGPVDADVRAGDRVRWSGDVYLIDGDVLRQPGPTARTSHSIIRLVKWRG